MAFTNSLLAGDASGWPGSISPVTQVTDLSAHVDGGPAATRGTNADADWDDMLTVHAGVILMVFLFALIVAWHWFMRKHIF